MKSFWSWLVVGAAALVAAAPPDRAWADPRKVDTAVPDADPELERLSFKVPEGWEITLYAADPAIVKPIQMNFDPAGRLWIATSPTYPQIKPGQQAEDKIVVLEDLDGDGRAEKSTVFADGLLIPTGLAPGDGGAYIANSTEVLHLKDTDGDGKADSSRVLLSGFGTEDTHHLLHTFRWGPEGLLYFNQSIYIHSHVETPSGIRRLMAGGIWRLQPENTRLEVFARGWWNAWGHQFDRWGQSFVTDGANGEGINYVVPDASYPAAYQAVRMLSGLNPGQPKLCGCEVLSGRHVPPEWQGSIISADFRGHRVARFEMRDEGAAFASTRVADLVTTDHVAFRPVDLRMGPDGAIYIADFYNPIINHGEVDFRDPRRDLTHGRIWRLAKKDRALVPRPQLVGASVKDLLAALKQPEDYTRAMAKRLLKERGAAEVLPLLAQWVQGLDPQDPDFEHQRLEALWVYQALDVVNSDLLRAVLASQDFHARAAAVRVIYHWQRRIEGPADAAALLAGAVQDAEPRVRLEAVCALRQLDDARSVAAAMRALDKPRDRFLDYTLWQTAYELRSKWLPEYLAGRLDFDGSSQHAVFALIAAGKPEVVPPLLELFRAGKIAAGDQSEVLSILGSQGGPAGLNLIFELALAPYKLDPPRRTVLLDLLSKAAMQRAAVRPAGDLTRVTALFDQPDAALRAAAIRLAGSWKLESARPRLSELAAAPDTSAAIRQSAIDGIVLMAGPASVKMLDPLCDERQPIGLRMMAAAGLLTLDLTRGADRCVSVLASAPADSDPAALFDAVILRKGAAEALIAALMGKSLPSGIADVGVRRAEAAGRDLKPLIAALRAAGKLDTAVQPLTPEETAKFVADIAAQGDATRGEAVFRRAALQCTQCHAIAGAGGQVGPDLVSIGASAPLDYLIESLFEPSKKIKEGFHTTVISTDAGEVFTGLLIRRNEREILLARGHRQRDPHSGGRRRKSAQYRNVFDAQWFVEFFTPRRCDRFDSLFVGAGQGRAFPGE